LSGREVKQMIGQMTENEQIIPIRLLGGGGGDSGDEGGSDSGDSSEDTSGPSSDDYGESSDADTGASEDGPSDD